MSARTTLGGGRPRQDGASLVEEGCACLAQHDATTDAGLSHEAGDLDVA